MRSKVFSSLKSVVLLAAIGTIVAGDNTAQSRKDREQARAYEQQADRAYNTKNYREAADKYGQSVALVSKNPNVYYRKGFAHYNLKEHEAAINALNTALSQGFKPPLDIFRIRHLVHMDAKNYDAALADIETGLKLAPADLDFLSSRGQILFDRRSYPEALAVFQEIVKLNPNSADTYYNIARLANATNDAAAQAAAAESALSKGTRFPSEAFFLLGDAYEKLKRPADAISAFQKAINAKPDRYETYTRLADVYRNENRLTDAINAFKQGLKAFPNDGGFYTELSWLYSLADRPDDAVDAARAGITLKPDQATAYTNLCRAYNEVKKYELAVGACNSALRYKPGDGETYFYLGRAVNLLGRSAEATKHYQAAVVGLVDATTKDPSSPDKWYLLGNAYFADNQRDKAIEAYLKGLELRPKFSKARYNLGIIYTLKKDKTSANSQYEMLLPLDPKLAENLRTEIQKI